MYFLCCLPPFVDPESPSFDPPFPSFSLTIPGARGVIAESQPGADLRKLQALEERRSHAALSAAIANSGEEMNDEQMVPRFTVKPRTNLFSVAEGKKVHFEAKLEPLTDSNLQVEWLKDGQAITVGHRFRPIHDFGYVALDIIDVISEDSGTYTCRATNLVGTDQFSLQLNCQGVFPCCFLKFKKTVAVPKLIHKFRKH